jgi:hypothetical protein
MNTNKKISFSFCIVFFCLGLLISKTTYGRHHHITTEVQKPSDIHNVHPKPINDDLDLFGPEEIDPLDNPTVTRFVKNTSFRAPAQDCSAQGILNALVPLGVSDLLEGNIYCHTNPLNDRNLDDLPLFLPHTFAYSNNLMVGTNLFWNQTPKMNFTAKSTSLDSYLALANPKLLEFLSTIQQLDVVKGLDLLQILSLFSTAHIEEHRIGSSFHAQWQSPFGDLRIFLPIYYFERNFNLGDTELARLAALTFEPSPGEQERFKKNHLISDTLGFGDLRLEWQIPLIDNQTFSLKSGLYTTLPTSWAFAKDIKGSTFCQNAPRPTINLEALCQNLSLENINKFQSVQDTLFAILDHLSANLIDAQFNTQQRHFSIAAVVQSKAALSSLIHRSWADHFTLQNHVSCEYFLPAWEKRFYILKADKAEFTRFDKYKNGQGGSETAEQDLAFLENRLVDVVYPYVFDTLVKPNFVFWWDAKAQYEYDKIGGFLGLDFWLKGKEGFGKIKGLPSVCGNLEVCKARKPLAYQVRALGSIFFKMEQPSYKCIISLNADKAFLSSGIGKDYTFALQCEFGF